MHRATALPCMLLLAACAHAAQPVARAQGAGIDGLAYDVALPRPAKPGERVLLEVRLGAVGSGQEVVLRTPDGALVGTASPHGIRPGNAAGTYVVPVPPAILARDGRDGHLPLRLRIEPAGTAPRPAGADEVLDVRAVVPAD